MRLLKINLAIKREHWMKSTQEILYTLILGLMPMWMGIILFSIFAPTSSISELIDHRQLVIFSTALLATGFFCVGQEFKRAPFPGRSWFLLALIILMVFATALFSGMLAVTATDVDSPFIELVMLRTISIALLVLSIIFVFLVSVINKAQTLADIGPEDILKEHSAQIDKLEDDFDGLGGL